ncbi:hypothetical protein ACNQVK_01505 [Mycobacterium sp. 134]|uniref:hypothetical protein n=1 Tax=Mycobacterium sp. 134 TaxID=3400425 RepID=UPI003AAD3D38
MANTYTERDMLDLLLARYTAIRRGTVADRWVRAEHVASDLGHRRTGVSKVADFVAADKYPGMPYGTALALHGHEVKVSRSDWLTELRDPTKAEAVKRYMHHWWLVVPDADIVKPGELPDDWGLLVKSGNKLRAKVAAPRLAPGPVPLDFTIALMAAATRTAYRDPSRRDAPVAYFDDRPPRCGFCGEPWPCSIHQPRKFTQAATA